MNTYGTFAIDPNHTNVEFAVRHMMISTVKGRFAGVQGTLELLETSEPRIEVTIEATSLDTRVEQRDSHLRSPDFFDVEKYPVLHFVSTKAERTDAGWNLVGNLTIKDVTRPVTLRVTEEGAGIDPWGNEKVAYTATTKFNRSEFGLNWNAALETGGVLVGDEIKVAIDAQLVKKSAAKAA